MIATTAKATYWQERAWAALATPYQPTVLSSKTVPAVVVADGPMQPKAAALGPRLAFVLLAVARLQDGMGDDVRGVTVDDVLTVVGGSRVATGRALRELDQARWLARYRYDGSRQPYCYKVTI